MSELEKFIRDHHDEFDTFEPDQGHFQRFEERMNDLEQVVPFQRVNHTNFLKVAAIILVLISVSVAVFDLATRGIRDRIFAQKPDQELPSEIREAIQYYGNRADLKMADLNRLAASQSDGGKLSAAALRELSDLDASTNELKKALGDNPGNERILDAMIRNQQMKEVIIGTMIHQLSKSVK